MWQGSFVQLIGSIAEPAYTSILAEAYAHSSWRSEGAVGLLARPGFNLNCVTKVAKPSLQGNSNSSATACTQYEASGMRNGGNVPRFSTSRLKLDARSSRCVSSPRTCWCALTAPRPACFLAESPRSNTDRHRDLCRLCWAAMPAHQPATLKRSARQVWDCTCMGKHVHQTLCSGSA